ncbi:unnamed protein product [Urochloa humidicola]
MDEAAEGSRLLLQEEGGGGDRERLLLPQDADLITGDESVDIKGRPAPKNFSTTVAEKADFASNHIIICSVGGNEFCERLAYYGIARNLVTYLKVKLHLGNLEAA